MVSKSTDSISKLKQSDGVGNLVQRMNQLKKQIQAERVVSIREKLQENGKNLEAHTSQIKSQPFMNRRDSIGEEENSGSNNMLSWRIENPICKLSGYANGFGDRDQVSCHDFVPHSSTKLGYVERLPPYTTWIFLDRNQRMADDQSVLGRRRIYYDDQHGSEALICSDSEEETADNDEDKREFTHGEDRLLSTVFREHGLDNEVVKSVSSFIGAKSLETEERYNTIIKKSQEIKGVDKFGSRKCISLDMSLEAALDSFDNLFCRRCKVFDCHLHGCSQNVIYPTEKQFYWSEHEEDRKPCDNQCYLAARSEATPGEPGGIKVISIDDENVPQQIISNPEVPSETLDVDESVIKISHESTVKRNISDEMSSSSKKQKKTAALDMENVNSDNVMTKNSGDDPKVVSEVRESKHSLDSKGKKLETFLKSEWKQMEKELYLKGLEIFGRNSCLIARNLLSGLKTCSEVSSYMHNGGVSMSNRAMVGPSLFMDENGKTDTDLTDQEMPTKSRLIRRRGKAKKLKYSTKSPGHPSIWKRIADGKNQSCKQYTPCSCTSMCGKQCSCHQNETCCEKYCGCSKSCKNRFRGCHCAKSQCRSRQCPCFAAGRECDPDVCRNCWVSCGDGTLDEPPRQGDGQCGNMRLLLRQQQRIILAKSDVAGWGAFIKNSVNKNDYLGEYTGELISHREADKRGKIYDRANSSFLFDLNEQYVLDAYRKGDKLKFANHSSNPNCYAKVMLVAGDHRVGIFAKDHIEASEELFYDYRYGPDQAPVWARKPEGSKRDDTTVSQGRAKKHQSH